MNRTEEALTLLKRNKIVGLADACHIVFENNTFPTEKKNVDRLKRWLIKQNVRGSIIKAKGQYANVHQIAYGRTPQIYLFNSSLIKKAMSDLSTNNP